MKTEHQLRVSEGMKLAWRRRKMMAAARGWVCPQCRQKPNPLAGDWRWNGMVFEHYHTWLGHVPCIPADPTREVMT